MGVLVAGVGEGVGVEDMLRGGVGAELIVGRGGRGGRVDGEAGVGEGEVEF